MMFESIHARLLFFDFYFFHPLHAEAVKPRNDKHKLPRSSKSRLCSSLVVSRSSIPSIAANNSKGVTMTMCDSKLGGQRSSLGLLAYDAGWVVVLFWME